MGPLRDVFVSESTWSEERRGVLAAREVKNDRGVPSGWALMIRS